MQHVEVLPLVLVNALDLHVEHPVRIEVDAGFGGDVVRQARLVLPLDRPPAPAEFRVIGQGFERPQLGQVDHPAVADRLVEQCAQSGVGQADETARRHTVGLIAEPLRPHLVEVFEDGGLDQFGVHRGNAVDGVTTHRGQIRHPNVPGAVLTDDRHPPHTRLVTGEPGTHFVEEAPVDLVDDFQVPR